MQGPKTCILTRVKDCSGGGYDFEGVGGGGGLFNSIFSHRKKDTFKQQWNPAITKCQGTEKNLRYSGVFVIAKTPL